MRQNFRPYSIVANLASIATSAITLSDSAGTPLKCNYVSVESSGGANGFFSVSLSSIQVSAVDDGYVVPAVTLEGFTSGSVGGLAPCDKGVVEFVLSDADRVDTLYLSQNLADATRYLINYGEVQHGNDLRDNLRPKGD
jgi:hypothetical protein